MGIDTLVVVLLVWIIAGLLVAIGFGMAAHHSAPDDGEGLAASAGTLKYFRKNKTRSHPSKADAPKFHHGKMKSV